MWFAALLGIGSLVLPIALFERAASATGLASLIPAAQAPLGMTARTAIAAAFAIAGALGGIAIARRVAAAHMAERPASHGAAIQGAADNGVPPVAAPVMAKRPISAHEELGEGGFDGSTNGWDAAQAAQDRPVRRRTLTATDSDDRGDFFEFAPLPGAFDRPCDTFADDPALDLAAFDAVEPAQAEDGQPGTDRRTVLATPPQEPATGNRRAAPVAIPEASGGEPAVRSILAEPGLAELVARFASALERHRAAAAETTPPAMVAAMPAAFQPFAAPSAERAMVESAGGADAGYSSLLAMKSAPPVRRPVGADTERALREALEKLQRLSGAA